MTRAGRARQIRELRRYRRMLQQRMEWFKVATPVASVELEIDRLVRFRTEIDPDAVPGVDNEADVEDAR